MDINAVLEKMDSLNYTEIEQYIIDMMDVAKSENDNGSRITLLNEIIGFCRDTCQHQKSMMYSDELISLLEEENLKGTTEYATSLLNIANAKRASGDLEESMALYKESYEIYLKKLEPDNFLFASINNNMALLYQEMNDYEGASECMKRALLVVEAHPEKIIEKAITLSNLAQSELREKKFDEAQENIEKAMEIYNDGRQSDFHYSAALCVYAELCFIKKQYGIAAKYYKEAIVEHEKHTGVNANGDIIKENYDNAVRLAMEYGQEIPEDNQQENQPKSQQDYTFIKGLEICRKFYEEYGKPMIHEKFKEYESKIAVGLVGEGSDCFGFDDPLSIDHDWGPAFCMWLDDETFEAIGGELSSEYDKLPTEYMGFERRITAEARKRTGVMTINSFYENLLGIKGGVPKTEQEWLGVLEENLSSVTNGVVFRDDEGLFTSIRNELLSYYPESVFRRKLAFELVSIAKTGQYNYLRCVKRSDRVTAAMYLYEFIEHTLKTVHLLGRVYAPYKKWLCRSASSIDNMPSVINILSAISDKDIFDENIPEYIETIAKIILEELVSQNLISSVNAKDSNFLEPYGNDIFLSIESLPDKNISSRILKEERKNELVDKIVSLEWNAFDKVINEGGRASCQDNWTTFSIMRKSQYLTWSEKMLESYIFDFEEALRNGWNLITEKYGRMEESTAPEEYSKIENSLPKRDEKTRAIVNEIVKIQVGFMEELANKYPNVAGTARSIHTYEDSEYNTSYETYLRGELLTYSPETLGLYGQYVVSYVQNGKNIAYDTMTNSAHLYGYSSLEELEEVLKNS